MHDLEFYRFQGNNYLRFFIKTAETMPRRSLNHEWNAPILRIDQLEVVFLGLPPIFGFISSMGSVCLWSKRFFASFFTVSGTSSCFCKFSSISGFLVFTQVFAMAIQLTMISCSGSWSETR